MFEKKWIKCEVSIGMFSTEWCVTLNKYAFFVDKDQVKVSEQPNLINSCSGKVKLQVLSENEEFSIVLLPTGEFQAVKNNLIEAAN